MCHSNWTWTVCTCYRCFKPSRNLFPINEWVNNSCPLFSMRQVTRGPPALINFFPRSQSSEKSLPWRLLFPRNVRMRSGDDHAAISTWSALSAATQCTQVPVEAERKSYRFRECNSYVTAFVVTGWTVKAWTLAVGLSEANQGSLAALQRHGYTTTVCFDHWDDW